MKKYTTNTKADPRKKLKIGGYVGMTLALPPSLLKRYSEFKIGDVRFYFKDEYTPLKEIGRAHV